MTSLRNPLELALENPWTVLESILDGPLHPGGHEATAALLDRADVGTGTRLLDVGCGAGDALELARERGATAVGLDRDPGDATWGIRGEMTALPVGTGRVDVVLGECVLCLAPSLPDALAEAGRVLSEGGRLAMSDVVVEGTPPDLPGRMAGALCLTGRRSEAGLVGAIEDAGFAVREVRDHRGDLLAMRDELAAKVDYEGLLGALGEGGQRVLDGVEDLETAIEDGSVGYVSLVASC
ncbi:MAG: class I SAM-dependent methyltransferase [Haloarculaceae archaeon]